MLCEVKPGNAGDGELEQLLWYVEKWQSEKAEVADETLRNVDSVAGVLLAENFFSFSAKILEKASKLSVHFVNFKFDEDNFPFNVITPTTTAQDIESEAEPKTKLKHSCLWMEEDWTQSCKPELVEEFRKWSNCLLDEDDSRHQWVTKIYKVGHVAIHYKGEYIIWLHPKPRANRLDGGYGYGGVNTAISWDHDSKAAKRSVADIIDRIDEQYADVCPMKVKW